MHVCVCERERKREGEEEGQGVKRVDGRRKDVRERQAENQQHIGIPIQG